MAKTGVLLVAFGAPESLASVEPFMRNLMGREPSEELLASAQRRYLTIGGSSPLPRRAERIAAALERALSGLPPAEETDETLEERIGFADESPNRATSGVSVPVAVGMLYWRPTIEQAVQRLMESGVSRIVWLSLSPFESSVTTGAFRTAVAGACDSAGVEAVEASGYHLKDPFASLLADACQVVIGELFPAHRPVVVFTAHSLPVDELGEGAYVAELEQIATRVAELCELGAPDDEALAATLGLQAFGGPGGTMPWLLAYQSRGARPGQWVGPDLENVIGAVSQAGYGSAAVCPIGFVVDHLETLYDIDVEAADQALSLDMEFGRAALPNDNPRMIEIFADAAAPYL